jgi:hypothetical protein
MVTLNLKAMEKVLEELPKEVYDEQRYNDAVNTLFADIYNQSEKAISTLKSKFPEQITNSPKSLEIFANEVKFKDFIKDARQSYINAVKFIPTEERERINSMYDNLYSDCIESVKVLSRIFALPYKLEYDGEKLVPNRQDIATKIRPNFKVSLTDGQRRYYQRIATVVNALVAMNDFEKENGINEFSTKGYSSLSYGLYNRILPYDYFREFTPERFLNSCINGVFSE